MNLGGVVLSRWRLLRNNFYTSGKRGRSFGGLIRGPLGAIFALLLAFLVGITLSAIFAPLAESGASASESGAALSLLLSATLVGLLIFDLHEAVSILITDSDLELLRRAPLSPWALFLVKLLDIVPRTSLMILILAVPAIVSFHRFYPLPPATWLVVPVLLASLWAIPFGLGASAAIFILMVAPVRRARETLGLISTITLLALWLGNSFLIPKLVEGESDSLHGLLAATGKAAELRLSPGAWAAGVISHAAAGEGRAATAEMLKLVAAATLSIALVAWVSSTHLETVRGRVSAGTRGSSPRPRPRPVAAAGAPAPHGPRGRTWRTIGALLARDRRLFLRDWTLLGDILAAAVLWTLLPLVGAPLHQARPEFLALSMVVVLSIGLGYEVAARVVPFERSGIVWMKLAPLRTRTWIVAKLIGAAAAAVPIVLIAAVSTVVALRLPPAQLMAIAAVAGPALLLALSIGIWTGAAFGREDWSNPRSMLTPTGRVVATALLLFQAGSWLAIAYGIHTLRQLGVHGALLASIPALVALPLAALPLAAAASLVASRDR